MYVIKDHSIYYFNLPLSSRNIQFLKPCEADLMPVWISMEGVPDRLSKFSKQFLNVTAIIVFVKACFYVDLKGGGHNWCWPVVTLLLRMFTSILPQEVMLKG